MGLVGLSQLWAEHGFVRSEVCLLNTISEGQRVYNPKSDSTRRGRLQAMQKGILVYHKA